VRYETWDIEGLLAEVGSRLRQERLNRNLTQQELANRAGVSVDTIRDVELGATNPTLRVLLQMLRGLDLLDRLDAMFPEPTPSPIQAAKLSRERRQRASKARPTETSDWEW